VRFLRQYLREHPVDAILSSGPPHTTHMIARGVKRATGLPWIADFRDPWTNIDFYDQLKLSRWADRRHHRLERTVLQEADQVVTVSWAWAEDFKRLGAPKVEVITNGFDEDEFAQNPGNPYPGFTLTHLGSINADRSPAALWQAMAELLAERPALKETFKVMLIGPADKKLVQILDELKLTDNVQILPYRPHDEAVRELMRSSALLLLLNNTPNVMGVIPGKLFEYLAAKRPILAIGPSTGDSARIIRETATGETCGFEDKAAIKQVLLDWHDRQLAGTLTLAEGSHTAYSRRTITGRMATLLNSLLPSKSRQP
jgi:glycosyltransferase involved in cell wall biosynthesis